MKETLSFPKLLVLFPPNRKFLILCWNQVRIGESQLKTYAHEGLKARHASAWRWLFMNGGSPGLSLRLSYSTGRHSPQLVYLLYSPSGFSGGGLLRILHGQTPLPSIPCYTVQIWPFLLRGDISVCVSNSCDRHSEDTLRWQWASCCSVDNGVGTD